MAWFCKRQNTKNLLRGNVSVLSQCDYYDKLTNKELMLVKMQ